MSHCKHIQPKVKVPFNCFCIEPTNHTKHATCPRWLGGIPSSPSHQCSIQGTRRSWPFPISAIAPLSASSTLRRGSHCKRTGLVPASFVHDQARNEKDSGFGLNIQQMRNGRQRGPPQDHLSPAFRRAATKRCKRPEIILAQDPFYARIENPSRQSFLRTTLKDSVQKFAVPKKVHQSI